MARLLRALEAAQAVLRLPARLKSGFASFGPLAAQVHARALRRGALGAKGSDDRAISWGPVGGFAGPHLRLVRRRLASSKSERIEPGRGRTWGTTSVGWREGPTTCFVLSTGPLADGGTERKSSIARVGLDPLRRPSAASTCLMLFARRRLRLEIRAVTGCGGSAPGHLEAPCFGQAGDSERPGVRALRCR